jgi:mRNA interferase HigB
MRVTHWGIARSFIKAHPEAEGQLKQWRRAVQQFSWTSFSDIRKDFGGASWVEGFVVFNIKGNDFRLVAIVVFDREQVYIKRVLTHQDYDG